jgi:hypothetical protein
VGLALIVMAVMVVVMVVGVEVAGAVGERGSSPVGDERNL